MTNKSIFRTRISERKFRQVLRLFAADIPALTVAELCLINYRTIHRLYTLWRERIVSLALEELRPFAGEIEIDESYFGPRRVRGKRGRGAGGKTPVPTDGWLAYDGLLTAGFRHHRIYHEANPFARGKNHINGIESFWSFAKARLAKLHGVRRDRLLIHLKECEWRFNHRKENRYRLLLTHCRQKPLPATLAPLVFCCDAPSGSWRDGLWRAGNAESSVQ